MNVLAAVLVVVAVASPISMPSPHQPPAQERRAVGDNDPQPAPAGIRTEEQRFKRVLRAVERAANAYEKQAETSPWAWPFPPLAIFAFFSMAIAALNVWLVILQRRRGYEQERARLFPELGDPPSASADEIVFEFPYRLVNHGRSPAWIVSRRVFLARVVDRETPAEPRGSLKGSIWEGEIAVAPGKSWQGTETELLSDADKGDMMQGKFELLLYGTIQYRDAFAKTHHAGFAWYIRRCDFTFGNSRDWSDGIWDCIVGPPQYWISD